MCPFYKLIKFSVACFSLRGCHLNISSLISGGQIGLHIKLSPTDRQWFLFLIVWWLSCLAASDDLPLVDRENIRERERENVRNRKESRQHTLIK